jgi:hypothetical protein
MDPAELDLIAVQDALSPGLPHMASQFESVEEENERYATMPRPRNSGTGDGDGEEDVPVGFDQSSVGAPNVHGPAKTRSFVTGRQARRPMVPCGSGRSDVDPPALPPSRHRAASASSSAFSTYSGFGRGSGRSIGGCVLFSLCNVFLSLCLLRRISSTFVFRVVHGHPSLSSA